MIIVSLQQSFAVRGKTSVWVHCTKNECTLDLLVLTAIRTIEVAEEIQEFSSRLLMRVVPVVTWPRQQIVLETEGKEKEKGGKFQMCKKMHINTVFCREVLRKFFYPNVFSAQF